MGFESSPSRCSEPVSILDFCMATCTGMEALSFFCWHCWRWYCYCGYWAAVKTPIWQSPALARANWRNLVRYSTVQASKALTVLRLPSTMLTLGNCPELLSSNSCSLTNDRPDYLALPHPGKTRRRRHGSRLQG